MRAPDFWYRNPVGLWPRLLAPLGWIYGTLTARRLRRAPQYIAPVPVICVGNINVGGTGKTPVTIALAEHLLARGQKPVIVTRGYGGRLQGPVLVDLTTHNADQTGDEALLMAGFCPVIVARNRAEGAKMAVDQGASVILMDDGFQNPDLHKTLSFVVVNGARGFGNGYCLPAGPLREPVQAGLKRADAVIVIGDGFADDLSLPVLHANLAPIETGMPWKNLPVLAFAGIGDPAKFFASLRELGADLRATVPLGDHAPLSARLLQRLQRQAQAQNAQLVTTEKDAMRLPPHMRNQVLTLPVRLQFKDVEMLDRILQVSNIIN